VFEAGFRKTQLLTQCTVPLGCGLRSCA